MTGLLADLNQFSAFVPGDLAKVLFYSDVWKIFAIYDESDDEPIGELRHGEIVLVIGVKGKGRGQCHWTHQQTSLQSIVCDRSKRVDRLDRERKLDRARPPRCHTR